MKQQAIINIVNSRLGKRSLFNLAAFTMVDKEMYHHWINFMDGKDCPKIAMTKLLQAVDVVVKYGNGDVKTNKIIAKFKQPESAQAFIEYVNKNDIRTSIFRVRRFNGNESERVDDIRMAPIDGWTPDDIGMGGADPYVALGID